MNYYPPNRSDYDSEEEYDEAMDSYYSEELAYIDRYYENYKIDQYERQNS